jgi:hypothetical protein
VLQGPEQALKLAYPLLEPVNLRAADYRFIRPNGCHASLHHQAPPSIKQVRRHPMPPRHEETDSPGAQLASPKLLFRRPAPLPRCSGDQFNPLIVAQQKQVLEDIPKPSELCRVSGRNGASSEV